MGTIVHVTSAGAQWCKKTADGWETLEPAQHDSGKPVWVVTDLAEETFSELAVPRIFGNDRSSFVNRQLANRYPDSVFRIALPAAQVGGIMDRLAPPSQTLTAIEPSDRVELALARIKAPVAGVWSTSMLMARLGQRPTSPKNMFVILSQSTGLRILFLKNRIPVLTRLVTTALSAQEQATEVVRTLRHLENTHVVERGKERFALLLLGGDEELKSRLNDDRLSVLEIPKKWAHYQDIGWNFLLFEAALRKPPGQLAPMKYRIGYLALETAKKAWLGTGGVLVVALSMVTMSLLGGFQYQQQQQQVLQQLGLITTQIQDTEAQIERFGVSPASVRKAVALDTNEVENIPKMQDYMALLGHSLELYPALRIKNWRWRIVEAVETACLDEEADPTVASSDGAEVIAEPEIPVRKAEVRWFIEFSSELGPYQLEQQVAAISAQVKTWKDTKLVLDPVVRIKRENISIASSAQSQASRTFQWCASVPIHPEARP